MTETELKDIKDRLEKLKYDVWKHESIEDKDRLAIRENLHEAMRLVEKISIAPVT